MGLSRQEHWSGVPLPSLAINKTAWGLYKDPKPCVFQSALPRASPAELPTLKAFAQTRELAPPRPVFQAPLCPPPPHCCLGTVPSWEGPASTKPAPNPTPPGTEGRGFQRRSASKAHSARSRAVQLWPKHSRPPSLGFLISKNGRDEGTR